VAAAEQGPSTANPGDDNGPFRSVIWRIGRVESDKSRRPRVILDDRPQRFATLDGVKVESLALREEADGDPDIFIGTDDENYGGILRTRRCVVRAAASGGRAAALFPSICRGSKW
jgi:hypothetical protein